MRLKCQTNILNLQIWGFSVLHHGIRPMVKQDEEYEDVTWRYDYDISLLSNIFYGLNNESWLSTDDEIMTSVFSCHCTDYMYNIQHKLRNFTHHPIHLKYFFQVAAACRNTLVEMSDRLVAAFMCFSTPSPRGVASYAKLFILWTNHSSGHMQNNAETASLGLWLASGAVST